MITHLIAIAVVALIIALLNAPGEALAWWRRGEIDELAHGWPSLAESFARPDSVGYPPTRVPKPACHYVVYLSGIGISSPDELPVDEAPTLKLLQDALPQARIIWDIYPYSVDNVALTQGRALAKLWRTLAEWKTRQKGLARLSFLINVRNVFQIFVSADPRYGCVFNQAIAQQILAALRRHGYDPASGVPVTVLGWSGGAQIAAGACRWLDAVGLPVNLISMAGILSDEPGLDKARQICHIHGSEDRVERIGMALFTKTWRTWKPSPWRQASKDGRLTEVILAGLSHVGAAGYYSSIPLAGSGKTPREITVEAIVDVVNQFERSDRQVR